MIFDEDVIINGNLTVNIPPNGEVRINLADAVGNPFGELIMRGNELTVNALTDDPSALRLGGPKGGKVSGNYLRSDGIHEEVCLINLGIDEEAYTSLGGQFSVWARWRNANGDGAMTPVLYATAAYSGDRRPVFRTKDPTNDLGPLDNDSVPPDSGPQIGPPQPDELPLPGLTVLSMTNLDVWPAGTDPVEILTSPTDGPALTAIDPNAEVELIVSMDLTGKTSLGVKTHRRTTNGIAPLVHIEVSEDGLIWNSVVIGASQPAWVSLVGSISGLGVVQVRVRSEIQSPDGMSFNIGSIA